ncbi:MULTISPECIES: DUF5412 family protein [Paenibacillus]|uniref:DUF5412 family protein n=1 Tax=Paenibacillus TaxID=44249 RepID=UPI003873AACC
MRKKKFLVIGSSLLLVTIVLGISGMRFYNCYVMKTSLSCLPQGQFIKESSSPRGTKTLKVYLSNYHSTTPDAIRIEKIENGERKNIYWNFPEEDAEIEWLDENIVSINNHLLDIRSEVYDRRKPHSNVTNPN